MLRELRVRDLALVAQASVRLGPGLNLLTGETGGGKSLIIDALSLCLGARAGADQVRHGARRASAEAVFDSVTLAREVGGRGGARIDGRPVPPGRLRELGAGLVALHGQQAHQALLDTEAQTELLDAYGGAHDVRAGVKAAHEAWTAAAIALRELEQLRSRGRREREHLSWQLEELRRADPKPGEDAELGSERAAMRHGVRLADLCRQAVEALREDHLARASLAIRSAAGLDPRLAEPAARLESLSEETAEVAASVRSYAGLLDCDPRRLEAIEARLALLDDVKRKHGGSLEAAVAERRRLEVQIGAGEDMEGAIRAAQGRLEKARSELESAAGRLTGSRAMAAERTQTDVASELQALRLQDARFEIELRPQAEIGQFGAEAVEMMFSANPGEPMAPLARVASGGELARVMLAIKTVTAGADRIPTLVFDEVDAGIGGAAAIQVGLRLKALGARHQVLVVTHLAQIASFADHHLLVEKARGADGRSVVAVRELSTEAERARELARMMSGGVTEKAMARARELLAEARR